MLGDNNQHYRTKEHHDERFRTILSVLRAGKKVGGKGVKTREGRTSGRICEDSAYPLTKWCLWGALAPAARFATAPPAAFGGRAPLAGCESAGLRGWGTLAARFATGLASLCPTTRSDGRRCAAWGFVSWGALPPAARFATAPPAAFGGLAPLAGRERRATWACCGGPCPPRLASRP